MRVAKIKGYDNYYIGDDGSVFSLYGGRITKMKTRLIKTGYEIVNLSSNNKYKTFKVHRLVAEAFIPNPDNKPQINHINCIRNDNRAENLEWMTAGENQAYSYACGMRSKPKGRYYTRPVYQIKDGEIIGEFPSCTSAGNAVGISSRSIQYCCDGVNKTAGGYIWRYTDALYGD